MITPGQWSVQISGGGEARGGCLSSVRQKAKTRRQYLGAGQNACIVSVQSLT